MEIECANVVISIHIPVCDSDTIKILILVRIHHYRKADLLVLNLESDAFTHGWKLGKILTIIMLGLLHSCSNKIILQIEENKGS